MRPFSIFLVLIFVIGCQQPAPRTVSASHDRGLQRLTSALDAAETQTDMNLASKKISEFWDAKLLSVESRIAQKLNSQEKTAFAIAKERWSIDRTREVQFRSAAFAGGSVQPLVANEIYSEVTEQRIAKLKSHLP